MKERRVKNKVTLIICSILIISLAILIIFLSTKEQIGKKQVLDVKINMPACLEYRNLTVEDLRAMDDEAYKAIPETCSKHILKELQFPSDKDVEIVKLLVEKEKEVIATHFRSSVAGYLGESCEKLWDLTDYAAFEKLTIEFRHHLYLCNGKYYYYYSQSNAPATNRLSIVELTQEDIEFIKRP